MRLLEYLRISTKPIVQRFKMQSYFTPHLGFLLVLFQFREMCKYRGQHLIEKFNSNKSQRNPYGFRLSIKSKVQDGIHYTLSLCVERTFSFTFQWFELRRNFFMMGLHGLNHYFCKINYLVFQFCYHFNWHNKHPFSTKNFWKFNISDRFL